MNAVVWSEYTASAPHGSEAWASSDRGWLKAICDPFEWEKHSQYTSETMPVWDADINAWREQSTLGNYLDYRPCREYESAEKPQVHAVCYVTGKSQYFMTVQQAREWIETEAASRRHDLAFQMVLIAA